MPQCAWLWIIICIELWKIHADKCMCCILFATCASDTWQMLICFLLVLFFIKVEFAKDSVETKLYTCMKMKITVSKIRWNYICRPGLTVIVIRLSFKEAKPYCFTNLLLSVFQPDTICCLVWVGGEKPLTLYTLTSQWPLLIFRSKGQRSHYLLFANIDEVFMR